jgi:recombination protein RecA
MGIPATKTTTNGTTKPSPVTPKEVELPEQEQRLRAALEFVNKNVEGSTLQRFDGVIKPIPVISTGSLALDCALGVGGIAQGKVIEVFGPESSGKTSLCIACMASAQKSGGLAAFIDVEHALDMRYCEALGVDSSRLLVCQPDSGEQALATVQSLIESGQFKWGDLIVVDSVAALTTKAEIDGDIGDMHMAQVARLMSQTLKTLVGPLSKSGATLFFTNQIRDTISMGGFGPSTSTSGGRALKFYASQRIETKKTGSVKAVIDGKEQIVANLTSAYIAKSKVAPPFQTAELTIRFGRGICKEDEVLSLGLKFGEVLQSGAWFKGSNPDKPRPTDPEELQTWWIPIGQGKENVIRYFLENPTYMAFLEKNLREGLHL